MTRSRAPPVPLAPLAPARARRAVRRGVRARRGPGRLGRVAVADAGPDRRSSPAQPGADPLSFLAWLFTPIFQAMFIILVAFYDLFTRDLGLPAAIGWAIVVLTLIVRALVIPLVRKQLVSQRRMQLLQPEIKEIQQRYKGDAMKTREAPAGALQGARHQPAGRLLPAPAPDAACCSSCTRSSQHGLTNYDPTAMLHGLRRPGRPARLRQPRRGGRAGPGPRAVHQHDHPAAWRRRRSTSASRRPIFAIAGFGISILAIISALLQLVQSRMMLPVASRRRRPQHQGPAPDDAAPAADLDRVRRLPAGRPVHLLDHRDDLRDRPAVPHRGLGRDVPALRLDARVRRGPHPAIPGGPCHRHPSPASVRPS